MEILKIENLSKIYRDGNKSLKAVDDINLKINEGEFIAIMGPSGSGKSTLLNLIGGIDNPTWGRVEVNGREIYSLNDDELSIFRRREIGFVFQFYNLIPTITVKQNIELPLLLDNKEADESYLKEVIKLLGLEDKSNSFPSTLSGGQKQRVAIARALISKPSIILADEPTGNLDTKTANEVVDLLKISVKKYHQTLIIITHDSVIASKADRVIRLMDGRVIGDVKN